jgi:hypothetical protein
MTLQTSLSLVHSEELSCPPFVWLKRGPVQPRAPRQAVPSVLRRSTEDSGRCPSLIIGSHQGQLRDPEHTARSQAARPDNTQGGPGHATAVAVPLRHRERGTDVLHQGWPARPPRMANYPKTGQVVVKYTGEWPCTCDPYTRNSGDLNAYALTAGHARRIPTRNSGIHRRDYLSLLPVPAFICPACVHRQPGRSK